MRCATAIAHLPIESRDAAAKRSPRKDAGSARSRRLRVRLRTQRGGALQRAATCEASGRGASLEHREVELGDRLVDQPAVVGVVEHLPRHLRGGDEGQLGHLGADLAEGAVRLGLDLAPRLLEAALPVGLGLLLDPLALRVRDPARLGEDLLGLAACLADELAVLLEDLPRFGARLLGLLERPADAVAALVD